MSRGDDLDLLLRDAVEDVEPADRLVELRRRVATERRSARRWWVSGGVVLAAAAAVVAVGLAVRPQADPGPQPTGPAPEAGYALPLYFVGDAAGRPVLFREFHRVELAPSLDDALAALSRAPDDPDYATAWTPGQLRGAQVGSAQIVVDVAPTVAARPAATSRTAAEASVQQVVYTLQAVAGRVLPVRFEADGAPLDRVLGVDTREPVRQQPALATLSAVSISDPGEGRVVDDAFSATGVADSRSSTVVWTLADVAGEVVASGTAGTRTGEGALPAWRTGPVDVSGLEPGRYTFTAAVADPSVSRPTPVTDTRTVVVR